MAAVPRCSECAAYLVDDDGKPMPRGTKTCGKPHRQARARRLKREAKERAVANASLPPHLAEVSQVVTAGAKDAAHTAMVEEMRPHVREAMTENVLAGIQTLVGLTGTAIAKLEADLDNPDDVIRQRAYTLLLKYTMGNPSVAPPPTHQAPSGMNVVFNVPRSDAGPGDATTPEVLDATELRTCGDCGEAKPEGEFAGAAPRCRACSGGLKDLLAGRFGDYNG